MSQMGRGAALLLLIALAGCIHVEGSGHSLEMGSTVCMIALGACDEESVREPKDGENRDRPDRRSPIPPNSPLND